MKVLVLTSESVSAQQLYDALPNDVAPDDCEVMVVAPALDESPIKFWFSDGDEAIAKADQVRRLTVERLGESGVAAATRSRFR